MPPYPDRQPMPLPLQSKGGELRCHVFENPLTGLARDLFWNLRVEFQPVRLDNDDWYSSFAVEWMTFPFDRWRQLDGMSLADVRQPDLVESSLYLFNEHHPAELRHLRFRETDRAIFEVEYSAVADVNDGDGSRLFNVHGKALVTFIGLTVGDSLARDEEDAVKALGQFLLADDLNRPMHEGTGFLFAPTT